MKSGVTLAGLMIMLAGVFGASSPASWGQDAPGEAVKSATATSHGDGDTDRRNPRRIRLESGEGEGPTMVAGGMSVGGLDSLEFLDRLEPLIGTFDVKGQSWRQPDAPAIEFTGEWTNDWFLDGQFLRMQFSLDFGRRPYLASGLLWYELRSSRYESEFFNSNNTARTIRWGDFGDDAKSSTLEMLARSSFESEDGEPDSKVVLEMRSENEFAYIGYRRSGEDPTWWKSYEMIMTRQVESAVIEPVDTDAG